MPVPATTGVEREKIEDMKIGDYIVRAYVNSEWKIGVDISSLTEIPYTGVVWGSDLTNKYHYMIKVNKGLLISDRVTHNTVSWDSLNGTYKWIQGVETTLGGISGKLRSLTGGVAYTDVNRNKSLTDQGYGGWPTNNEWDMYIVNFPKNKIQQGKTVDDVFHHNRERDSVPYTYCQDTTINGLVRSGTTSAAGANNMRVYRAKMTALPSQMNFGSSSGSGVDYGFRPVFEYKEV
ncbi:hypothetical protein [Paenibacillus sp. TH7-28]